MRKFIFEPPNTLATLPSQHTRFARKQARDEGGEKTNLFPEGEKLRALGAKWFIIISFLVVVLVFAWQALAAGFDQFGYNYKARIFVGKADGVDRNLDGKVWGDPTYANDNLVMKWSKAWDDARFGGKPWTPDAWVDNEWNGMMPGGSSETWHYKIIWVGSSLENSPYWREGGYPVWGEFEVILSQGTAGGEHIWETHAIPTGYGSN